MTKTITKIILIVQNDNNSDKNDKNNDKNDSINDKNEIIITQ